jgi:DNA replication protein DnaC
MLMLTHPTLDQLRELGLDGMLRAYKDIEACSKNAELSRIEWLGLLLDREITHRRDKRLAARLRYAKLRHQACLEDVDYQVPRGLDKSLLLRLVNTSWLDDRDNLLICGPAGIGKSWLACALGHQACRDNHSVLYQRIPKLFTELALGRGDGRYARLLRSLSKVQLLIIDDFGLAPIDTAARHDLLEILEERHGRTSTIITSQFPVQKWYELIGDPTYADAILDRIVHNAHRINLAGESLRKNRKARQQQKGERQ